jgi:hypothetical protein
VSSSLPSVKRTLSDPEIHFTNQLLGGHPIILTVNPSSELAGEAPKSVHQICMYICRYRCHQSHFTWTSMKP